MRTRKIIFVEDNARHKREYIDEVKLPKIGKLKIRKTMLKTSVGYIDCTVELDRLGRLKSVKVEASRYV